MDINNEIWNAINQTPKIPEEVKKSLHLKIMRLVEQQRATPVGKKHGVTVMTQEASLAGDQTAQDRRGKGTPGQAKPKNI